MKGTSIVENTFYHLVQIVLSSLLTSKNAEIRIYEVHFFCSSFNGHKSWSLTMREEHTLELSENMVLCKTFGPNREEITCYFLAVRSKSEENCTMKSFKICIPPQKLSG
jgi:hypothetical protein